MAVNFIRGEMILSTTLMFHVHALLLHDYHYALLLDD